ncbi:MAG: PSD1 and planctomycete cytochrome C domain-containing protein [Verrucomicrobia bacterium]|nr:PSD1 and planctomycete cytochrome C domain-containing protein [Verrucomicrobiota bacterium]
MRNLLTLFLLAGSALHGGTEFSAEDITYFSEKVRPVLEEHCFRCHGGLDKEGKAKVRAGLQLISRKGILMGGEHGPAFDEADSAKSLILHVLSYEDDDLKMPPKGKLEPEVAAVFAEWVKRGLPWTPEDADYLVEVEDEHGEITTINETTKSYWSYKPMVRPEVPVVDDAAWSGPIDAFIYEGVRKAGLMPNEEADRAELIRRVQYDLTGLPPSLEEVRAFEEDQSADAWEKVVDRLLASPAYGEKWGRHWLDVVRYAETNGFERDSDKPEVWRYRDYVIDAFNSDKPYDVFLREQLAGDELPEPSLASMTATGYHRLMQWDDEPADRKQHYFDVLDDNVRTTTEGMLAMTMGCARCHDHKGDPISQADYYSFLSFFRGIAPTVRGKGATESVRATEPDGEFRLAQEEQARKRHEVERELRLVDGQLRQELAAVYPDLAAELNGEGVAFVPLLHDARADEPTRWHYTTERPPSNWSEVGFRAEDDKWRQGMVGIGSGGPNQVVRTAWEGAEIWLQTTFQLEKVPQSVRLSLYHDDDLEVYLNGQPVLALSGFVQDYLDLSAEKEFLDALQTGRNVVAVHVRQRAGSQYFDLGMSASDQKLLSVEEVLKKRGKAARESALTKKRRELEKALTVLQAKAPAQGVQVLTVSEKGKEVPPTYVQIRGNANAEDEDREVQPRVPGIFGGEEVISTLPSNGRKSSGRRTALADWICRDDNPRTARVMMNRVWQHHFGRGICPTPNDFGYLGEKPTHPELLDWLGTEFVAKGWSLKAMHKEILLSRAYRMSSRGTEEGLAKDPDNNTFWRFEMRRLTAEEARDSVLAVTGTLERKMGGPSVYIPLPPEVIATASNKGGAWGKSSPEDEVRRSVYVKVKRSLVPPQFADLDVADTDASCPVRFTTTVPTQALGFLNSAFMNDQAKLFAKRMREEAGPERKDRVRLGLELALSRPVSEREMDYGNEVFEAMRGAHGLSEDEALERFALLVLNLNEFIFLD